MSELLVLTREKPPRPAWFQQDDLVALLERVKAATGPDKKLDAEIWYVVEGVERPSEGFVHPFVPPFTSSVNAALALVDGMLPDPNMQIARQEGNWFVTFTAGRALSWQALSPPHWGSSLPLAILVALLSALIAKENA